MAKKEILPGPWPETSWSELPAELDAEQAAVLAANLTADLTPDLAPDLTPDLAPDFAQDLPQDLLADLAANPDEAATLRQTWLRWQPQLRCRRLATAPPLLLCWLEEPVEAQVDQAWQSSPSAGYRLDSLAAAMCMTALRRLLPAAVFSQRPGQKICAPLPPLTAGLEAELAKLGLLKPGKAQAGETAAPLLQRRYAVLTYAEVDECGEPGKQLEASEAGKPANLGESGDSGKPGQNGCARCVLRPGCPGRF